MATRRFRSPQNSEIAAPKRARGAQPGNSNRTTHGLSSLARRLRGAGLQRVDGRSALERLKRDWKNEIRTARGGELTPQLEALLETAANTMLMLSTCDNFILERGAINRRKSSVRPIVEQRAKLVRSLRELLTTIGLEREPELRDPLRELVERYAERKAQDEPDDAGEPEASTDG